MRGLGYWKGRRQELKIILKAMKRRDEYYAEMYQAYLYTIRKENKLEKLLLV